MTADHNAAARAVVQATCGDSVCTFTNAESCGCFKAILEFGDRARQEGRREGLEEAARKAEWEIDRFNEGARDQRFAVTRGPKWRDGPAIAEAIRALATGKESR